MMKDAMDHREAEHDINTLFLKRWSPRAMTGQTITQDTMNSLLEAARWAPSSYNGQPWRFFYARRGDKYFDEYMDLVNEFNQSWAKDSGALLVVTSTQRFDHNDEYDATNEFSVGAAYENMALEAAERGLVMHGMAGIHYDKAKEYLGVPDHYKVICMAAIGHPAEPSSAQSEKYKNRRCWGYLALVTYLNSSSVGSKSSTTRSIASAKSLLV